MKITKQKLRQLIRETILEVTVDLCSICRQPIDQNVKRVNLDGRKYLICSSECLTKLENRPR